MKMYFGPLANGADPDKMQHSVAFHLGLHCFPEYSKTCVKRSLKNRQNKDPNDKWKSNAGQKYCRMLQEEHSTIFLTCIKQSLVLKTNL